MRTNVVSVLSCVLLVIALTQGAATASITPVGATTSSPIAYTAYGSSLANVIDGVPNYDQWLALGQEGGGPFTGPYTVSFDLVAPYSITGFNLWNNGGNIENDGEGIDWFSIEFHDPAHAPLGLFTTWATDTLAEQSWPIPSGFFPNAQYAELVIGSNHAMDYRPYVIFYEVSFEGTPTVPVPGALLLGGIGAGVIGWMRRLKVL